VAVPSGQAVRTLLPHKFAGAQWNVTVGRRWFWGGLTLQQLRERSTEFSKIALPTTRADDPAAIIFTSGSTGPAKGVLYSQRMFDTQVTEI
jgi:olefin beta-lactone synthetase